MSAAVEVPVLMPGASIRYCPDFLDRLDQKRLHRQLLDELHWNRGQVTVFGKSHPIPRLEAWHGDPLAKYRYSGTDHSPHPWTLALDEVRHHLEIFRSDLQFNSVLGNLYRDGEDAMGWHSDDEPELGENPCIASVSLGAGRDFRLRHRTNKDIDPVKIHLESGSLLLMEGSTQKYWQHSIPRRRGRNSPGERINLTFRTVLFA